MCPERRLFIARIALASLLLAACGSGGQIRSDYDRGADFANYRSFGFVAGAGSGVVAHSGRLRETMISAISAEMQNRGYTRSESPDLLVNFNALLGDDAYGASETVLPVAYYAYRIYEPWPGYTVSASRYAHGTFNIDLVDARKSRLVWEAIGELSADPPADLETALRDGVPELFAHYPFRAPPPLPRPIKQDASALSSDGKNGL